MNLVALLPKDRYIPGTLEVWHNSLLLTSFPCLGKADDAIAVQKKNPRRNPERPYGDTPTGVWKVHISIVRMDTHTSGPHRILLLSPVSGQASKAYSGPQPRSGIEIRGGDPGPDGELCPTNGAIRVFNQTLAALHELIAQYGRPEFLETKEI